LRGPYSLDVPLKKSINLGASVKFYQHMQKDKAKQWPKVPGGILEILQVLYIVYS